MTMELCACVWNLGAKRPDAYCYASTVSHQLPTTHMWKGQICRQTRMIGYPYDQAKQLYYIKIGETWYVPLKLPGKRTASSGTRASSEGTRASCACNFVFAPVRSFKIIASYARQMEMKKETYVRSLLYGESMPRAKGDTSSSPLSRGKWDEDISPDLYELLFGYVETPTDKWHGTSYTVSDDGWVSLPVNTASPFGARVLGVA